MLNKFLFILFLGLASCATKSHKTGPLKYSLVGVKEVAIATVPSGIKSTSPNGRELYFDYHPLPSRFAKRRGQTKDGKFLERAQTKVVVLGERRPYVVEVEVRVESLQYDGTYKFVRYSPSYSKFLTYRIQKSLAKRQESRDLIDDFRPF